MDMRETYNFEDLILMLYLKMILGIVTAWVYILSIYPVHLSLQFPESAYSMFSFTYRSLDFISS